MVQYFQKRTADVIFFEIHNLPIFSIFLYRYLASFRYSIDHRHRYLVGLLIFLTYGSLAKEVVYNLSKQKCKSSHEKY